MPQHFSLLKNKLNLIRTGVKDILTVTTEKYLNKYQFYNHFYKNAGKFSNARREAFIFVAAITFLVWKYKEHFLYTFHVKVGEKRHKRTFFNSLNEVGVCITPSEISTSYAELPIFWNISNHKHWKTILYFFKLRFIKKNIFIHDFWGAVLWWNRQSCDWWANSFEIYCT